MLKSTVFPLRSQTRWCSSLYLRQAKPEVILDENTKNLIENNELKPRQHPGIAYTKNVELPKWVTRAIDNLIEDEKKQSIMEDAQKFYRHLAGRHAPAERHEVDAKFEEIKKILRAGKRMKNTTFVDEETADDKMSIKALKLLKRNVKYCSPAVEYTSYSSLLYLVARSAPDYAVMYKIFHEIKTRDKDFEAKSLLDFGSGISTVSWAAMQFWSHSLKEHICIDASKDISALAEDVITYAKPKISGIFHRQFLPVAHMVRYDIVVSAFSLFDLPDRKSRLEVILNLWKQTGKYLVLVEQGTNAGFKVINEARDMILYMLESAKENKEEIPEGHIFSPCPHELTCPRLAIQDGSPCNFLASYTPYSIIRDKRAKRESFSYVVFKKGAQKTDDEKKWPRIVRPTLVRSKCTICRMCIPSGKLMEVYFTAGKHERPLYYCARSSSWSDRLPIEIVREKKE